MSIFEIIIASVPDRENVVAEIWHEQKMLAEVSNENGIVEVELYPGDVTRMPLHAFLDVLTDAQKMLANS